MSHRLLVLPLMITVLVFASLADVDAVVDGHRPHWPTLDQIESGSLKEAESVLHHHYHRHQRASGNDDAEGLMATKVNTAAEEEDEDEDGDRYEDTWMARRALAHDPTRSNWEEFSAGYQVLLAICFLLLAIMLIFSLFWFRRKGGGRGGESSEGEDKRRQKQQQRQSPKNSSNNNSSSSSSTPRSIAV